MAELKLPSLGISVTLTEKPAVVCVKRKASPSSLDSDWLEINGRPLKRLCLDFEQTSDHMTIETLNTKRLLVQALEDILQALVILVRSSHFEQVWKSKKRVIDSLLEICHLYNIFRVDGEDEEPIKKKEEKKEAKKEAERISPEDDTIIRKYLPLLREHLPSAVEEIESELKSYASSEGSGPVSTAGDTKEDDYLYDPNTADEFTGNEDEMLFDYSSVQVKDEDDFNDILNSDNDSEDSNAPDYPRNDYPDDRSLEDYEVGPFGVFECPNFEYDEEMDINHKKDEQTYNNGDEDMDVFSNSEYLEHDDKDNLKRGYCSCICFASDDHSRNDYSDKESSEDDEVDFLCDSERTNHEYKEEMARNRKKDEGTSNNGDEDMMTSSNSEYSDSEHDDEDSLRCVYCPRSCIAAKGHPRNDCTNKESLEADEVDPLGDSEDSNSDYGGEMASNRKKDEGTSNNGDEDMEASSNSEYSDSEHDDEDNLRCSYCSRSCIAAEGHPRNDCPHRESLEDDEDDPLGDSEGPNSDYGGEMISNHKKDEETSNNGDEDMDALGNSEYSDSEHDDEDNLRCAYYSHSCIAGEDHYPHKESLEDNKVDSFGDSECRNSDYDGEMTSNRKKDEEAYNNGDEDMKAFSNSEYSDSELEMEISLRLR